MAKLEELIAKINDPTLREEIAGEVRTLKKEKQFGLVFEEHLPENVRLARVPVREGDIVAERGSSGNDLWQVLEITAKGKRAKCRRFEKGYGAEENSFPLQKLVAVKRFGEPIYPALTPVDRISRGGAEKPWHTFINADNFHALQLLLYCYEGQVDVIYIDPPYNTGARDWKYNNDYVDSSDSFRHSKWLSMMKKRLTLAKKLLKPDSGVLVVTVDEHEVHNLGVLLRGIFPECFQQMVTIVINQKGVAQGRLSRVEEYAIFCFRPEATVLPRTDDLLNEDRRDQKRFQQPRWEWLLRGGTNSRREDRPGLFFPIYIDPKKHRITKIGDPLSIDEPPDLPKSGDRTVAWPIRTDGSLGNWRVSPPTLRELLYQGYVKLGGFDQNRKTWTVLYLGQKARQQIERGEIKVVSRDKATKVVEIEYTEGQKREIKTVWHRQNHDAGNYGSMLLRNILGEGGLFSFPKSLYSVVESLRAALADKPNGLVVDFFAGSGTTLHASALLNAEDGGSRRCILVTNNEVEEKLAKQLTKKGCFAGETDFEKNGICEAVTWPRCKYAIAGKRDDGTELPGKYLTLDKDGNEIALKDGFAENLEYFRLDFLDPHEVARGDALRGHLADPLDDSRLPGEAWKLAGGAPTGFSPRNRRLRC